MHTLSVLITSWNARDVLLPCLHTLFADPVPFDMEIVVVDNGSTDGTSTAVQRAYPTVKLLRIEHNRGYSAGANVGLRACTGRYVLLLNSDTLVPTLAVSNLVAFMDAHPDAGACGPRLVLPQGMVQEFAFGGDPTLSYLLRRGFARVVLKRALHDWSTTAIQKVDWVSGTALMVRQTVVQDVGGLDEEIYAYFEDVDWCMRIRAAGYVIYFVPHIAVTHIGGQSLRKDPAAQNAYYTSLRYCYRKHYGRLQRMGLGLFLPYYRWITRQ
jgi:N-acetylglucosaminyl-diphospho-decaprenol L-rhamnosyltransferase